MLTDRESNILLQLSWDQANVKVGIFSQIVEELRCASQVGYTNAKGVFINRPNYYRRKKLSRKIEEWYLERKKVLLKGIFAFYTPIPEVKLW